VAKHVGEDKSAFLHWYNEDEDAVFNNTRAEIAVNKIKKIK
jgi:hypothetical protein